GAGGPGGPGGGWGGRGPARGAGRRGGQAAGRGGLAKTSGRRPPPASRTPRATARSWPSGPMSVTAIAAPSAQLRLPRHHLYPSLPPHVAGNRHGPTFIGRTGASRQPLGAIVTLGMKRTVAVYSGAFLEDGFRSHAGEIVG